MRSFLTPHEKQLLALPEPEGQLFHDFFELLDAQLVPEPQPVFNSRPPARAWWKEQ